MIFTIEVDITDPEGVSSVGRDNDWHDESHLMLSVLLANEIVYIIDEHLFVNCNDMFAWALADLEYITLYEIPDLFYMWYKEPKFGALKWVAKKRNLQPQKPVIEWIKRENLWDEEWEALDFGHYNRAMAENRKKKDGE